MKKILSLCMALIMLLGMCGIASAETAAFNEAPYKTVELDQNDPAYWQTEWEAQVYNYKMVRNFPTLYEKDAWDAAQNTGSLMMNIHPDALTDANKEQILAAKAAIADLKNHQLKPFSDGINGEVIYIWGDKMPVTTPAEDLQFPLVNYEGEAIYDNADFVPFIIPYLLENPGEAKGTIILLSGGGNIRTMLQKFYGDITPDQFDPSYVCDEIDAVNSDVDVAHIIYSAGKLETENPHLPHLFIAVGADDNGFGRYGFESSYEMFKQAYELGLDPELQVYAKNGHGFGAGNAGTTSMLWMASCDMYMQKVMGLAEVKYEGEIPAEYTLTQDIVVDWFPISDATTVNVYTTADHSKVLFTFFGWGENIMVEGLLIGGHLADVTFDSVGYFGQDAYKMWDLIDPAAWLPVQK